MKLTSKIFIIGLLMSLVGTARAEGLTIEQ